jgi:thiosulfate/3-mercaptopyruvate sulfurtransferase
MWNPDGSYRSRAELLEIVEPVLGPPGPKQIIVYCGVGGYASSGLYTLVRVLGYSNVRMYDGSAQEWVRYYDMEL